ncbi:hypothetical protein BC830DRAFT_1124311 [Chytriomyces sp. MP71]|nr:hypothetical protein BC830DRAFT_1124311 [Chytriomyces sp. MP71]
MSRHSKNNTSLAFFTNAEREKLTYGTRKQRMGTDSMRRFDACFLCLSTARDPMVCDKGHVACKECFFENILAQKSEFQRLKALFQQQQELMDKEVEQRTQMLRQAEVDAFARTQTSVLGTSSEKVASVELRVIDGTVFKGIKTNDGTIYVPDVSAISASEKEKLLQNMKELDKAGKKRQLPSFWVPSLTPDAAPTPIEALPAKIELRCVGCDPPHSIASFKKLVKVNFTYPSSGEKEAGAIESESAMAAEKSAVCPTCVKSFTNGSKIMIVKDCGHAVCKDCFSRFMKGSNKCHVCDVPSKSANAIELFVEGTGFASSGGLDKMARKVGVAFQ